MSEWKSEVTVFRNAEGYYIPLRPRTVEELEEIKARLSGLYTFRRPNR